MYPFCYTKVMGILNSMKSIKVLKIYFMPDIFSEP